MISARPAGQLAGWVARLVENFNSVNIFRRHNCGKLCQILHHGISHRALPIYTTFSDIDHNDFKVTAVSDSLNWKFYIFLFDWVEAL